MKLPGNSADQYDISVPPMPDQGNVPPDYTGPVPPKLQKGKGRKRQFWGIDGEGMTDPKSGRDIYTYLAAKAVGQPVRSLYHGGRRLTSRECLDFLWSLGGPQDFFAFFHGGYDWSNILADVDDEVLKRVYVKPSDAVNAEPDFDRFEPVPLAGHGYGMVFMNNAVELTRGTSKRKQNGRIVRSSRFFADLARCGALGPFADVLRQWGIGTTEQLDRITEMKRKRSKFTDSPEERAYCDEEVDLLGQLAEKMITAAEDVDIAPRRWYSGGSGAKHLAMANDTHKHHSGPGDRYAGASESVKVAIRTAFGGGRFEAAANGLFHKAYQYDLASAYPAAMVDLPCINPEHGGRWYHRAYGPWRLYKVQWHWQGKAVDCRWTPFQFRTEDGNVQYPTDGTTWCWAPEYHAGIKMKGFDFEVLDVWSWVTECDHKPWAWMRETYAQRQAMDKGNASGNMLKIVLNSGYGKTADGLTPESKLASLVWAGWITSFTRAKLVEVMAAYPDNVIMAATDAVFTDKPVLGQERSAKVLGQWEYEDEYDDLFIVMPGVYFDQAGKIKSRGHSKNDFEDEKLDLKNRLMAQWKEHGYDGQVTYTRNKFISPRAALLRIEDLHNQWVDDDVTMKFAPTHRMLLTGTSTVPFGRTSSRPSVRSAMSVPYSKLASDEIHRRLLADRTLAEDQP